MQFSEKIRLQKNNFLLLVVMQSQVGMHHIYLEITGDNYKKLQQSKNDNKEIIITEYGKIVLQGKGEKPTGVEKLFIKEKYKLAN